MPLATIWSKDKTAPHTAHTDDDPTIRRSDDPRLSEAFHTGWSARPSNRFSPCGRVQNISKRIPNHRDSPGVWTWFLWLSLSSSRSSLNSLPKLTDKIQWAALVDKLLSQKDSCIDAMSQVASATKELKSTPAPKAGSARLHCETK